MKRLLCWVRDVARYFLIMSVLIGSSELAFSKDWVLLHSTEPEPETRLRHMLFLQPQYARTTGTPLSAGPFQGQQSIFNLNPPDFDESESLQIVRALGMLRGNIPGTEGLINYFVMADAGDNIVTGGDRSTTSPTPIQLTDLSLTFNYLPFARVRAGQFITPGSNVILKPVQFFDFANFTHFTIYTMLDWQMRTPGNGTTDNRPPRPNAGFRDIGLMVFDSFKISTSLLNSYALMIGNGDGITRWDPDSHQDIYWRYRLQWDPSEQLEIEFVHWGLTGHRDLFMPTASWQTFRRQRHGFDLAARFERHRIETSYGYADGMIFHGTLGAGQPGIANGGGIIASFLTLPTESARGFLVSYNFDYSKRITVGARYDQIDYGLRSETNQRRFSTLALSTQYKFNETSPTRLMLNYEFRDASAPRLPDASAVNQFLAGIDDRISLNLFWFL